MEIKTILKKELGKNLKEKESLKKHTSIKIGGPADFYYTALDKDDLIKAIKLAQKHSLPYLVIGEGTNLIFADTGFPGLVIQNEAANLVFEKNLAFAESGISLYRLIRKLAEVNLGGLEFLAGIPGTLGGAIYGNAGAYGKSIADVIESVTILDSNGEIKQIKKTDFGFKYRESILKSRSKISQDYSKKPVILSAKISIRPLNKEAILRVVENYTKMKWKKIPTEPSSGCVFKNIEIEKSGLIEPKLTIFVVANKIPAGLLIDKCDLRGVRKGKIKVSEKHANFLVNTGRGKAADFLRLANLIKDQVKEKYHLDLEEEIEYIGDIEINKKGIFAKMFKR